MLLLEDHPGLSTLKAIRVAASEALGWRGDAPRIVPQRKTFERIKE